MNWVLAVGAVALLGTAVVTLRAAEQATQRAATSAMRGESGSTANARGGPAANLDGALPMSLRALPAGTASSSAGTMFASPAGDTKQHPPASAPEESATITDDPTTAPDPSQSADNNVSFPTNI